MLAWSFVTSAHSDSHASDKLAPTTLACSLLQLWRACSHNSNMLTFTTDMVALTAQIYSLLKLWLVQSHNSDMLTLTFWTIWLCWEQAGSSWSGFAGRGETGFTGSSGSELARSTMVGVDVASPVAQNLDSLWAGKKLRIWLHWEQAGSYDSGYTGNRE